MSLLILNGRLIDPVTGRDGLFDLLVEDKIITGIKENLKDIKADEVIDATGMYVTPGFVDLHVHLREPGYEYKETILTGTRAAARGGFTTIASMPNTKPVNDTAAVFKVISDIIRRDASVKVLVFAAVTRGLISQELVDIDELMDLGACGFTNDGCVVPDSGLLLAALKRVKDTSALIMEHPEDISLSPEGVVNKGFLSEKYKLPDIPNISEDIIIARDLLIQGLAESNLHLTHVSTAGAKEMIKAAKERGVRVTSDVTPHHLLLNDEMFDNLDPVFKVKPPIRAEKDRQAMIAGIMDGTIDCIATDHAPHSVKDKKRQFIDAPFGLIGLETAFNLIHDRFVRRHIIPIHKLVELFSSNPARILKLDDRGSLDSGKAADITIIDPHRPFKIKVENFVSKSSNSPFLGWQGIGDVVTTIVDGRIVYKGLI